MKTSFTSISVVYWVIVGSVLWTLFYNNSYKGTLDFDYIVYFSLTFLAVYLLAIVLYRQMSKKYKNININITDDGERVYYESKIQYYLISLLALLIFSIITFFDIGGLSKVSIYFLYISIFALAFVFFYQTSTFTIGKNNFVWKKGSLKIECPWSDLVAVHRDIEPAFSNIGRKFHSTSFFIETKKGLTKYADMTNIKVRGVYTLYSLGDQLVKEIKLKAGVNEKYGEVSMFKQTQKLKDIVFLLLGLFLIPIFIIILYALFTGYNLFDF